VPDQKRVMPRARNDIGETKDLRWTGGAKCQISARRWVVSQLIAAAACDNPQP
jgi:hypothetical protein